MGHIKGAKSTYNQSQQPSPRALDSHEKLCNQFIYVTKSANRRLQEFKNTRTFWDFPSLSDSHRRDTKTEKRGCACASVFPPLPSLSPLPFTAPLQLVPAPKKLQPRVLLCHPWTSALFVYFLLQAEDRKEGLFPVNRGRENYSFYCFDNGSPCWNW